MNFTHLSNLSLRSVASAACAFLLVCIGPAQAFDSGSNGSDGALDYSALAPGTIVNFDPTTHVPPLDVDGDNVYHFTSITIPAAITVKLRANKLNWTSVTWLASGPVTINGTLDADGEAGITAVEGAAPNLAIPGPGGYAGGYGATNQYPRGTGLGPVEGGAGADNTASIYLLPLIGGSGGDGGSIFTAAFPGGGGGGGGGAILIASNASITVGGSVTARGGAPGVSGGSEYGQGGAGGSIRLMSETISGAGVLNVDGIYPNQISEGGVIRIEAVQDTFAGTLTSGYNGRIRRVALAPNPVINAGQTPKVRIVTINGIAVPQQPNASFALPDVTLNTGAPATFAVQAKYIPLGTTVTLYIFSESTLLSTATSTALGGTLENSTATATAPIPAGHSRLWARAVW